MEKIKSILSYIFPVIGGIIVFFTTPKEESSTKFQAVQSIVLGIVTGVIGGICGCIPFIGGMLSWLVGILFLVLTVMAILGIIKEQEPELPLMSDITKAVLKNV